MVHDLTAGLIELGLLEGDVQARIDDESYRRFYLHSTSHWLGLDVHDVGTYRLDEATPRLLAPGMVLTVEPGLYILMKTIFPLPIAVSAFVLKITLWLPNRGMTFSLMACRN